MTTQTTKHQRHCRAPQGYICSCVKELEISHELIGLAAPDNCPFCDSPDTEIGSWSTGVHWIACRRCYAQGPHIKTEDEQIVIKEWNTRCPTKH